MQKKEEVKYINYFPPFVADAVLLKMVRKSGWDSRRLDQCRHETNQSFMFQFGFGLNPVVEVSTFISLGSNLKERKEYFYFLIKKIKKNVT